MVQSYGSSTKIPQLTFADRKLLQCGLHRLAGAASAGQADGNAPFSWNCKREGAEL